MANGSVNAEDRGYTYDTAWNLNYRTNNGALSMFIVDTKNELTNSTPGGVSTFDSNGNLTNSSGVQDVYMYDDENRLVTWAHYFYNASTPTNGDLWTDLAYDGVGRLRVRWEYSYVGNQTAPGTGWQTNSETHYLYDGWRVIQERDGSNTPLVSYTRGTDLSGSLEGAGGIGGLLARSTGYLSGNWSTHNFYHADGNGNITYLVSSSQALAATYRYDPYGNLISSSGSLASANVYRFSSKEIHVNSGLYYYGYRWYAPNLQRWLSRDSQSKGQQLYSFSGNAPIRYLDPWGQWHTTGQPRPDDGRAGIVCDGKGGIRISYPPGYDSKKINPCIQGCVDTHENCHKTTVLNANPDICKGQPDGTGIAADSDEENAQDEIRCSEEELDCLEGCKGKCPKSALNKRKKQLQDYQKNIKKS